MSNCCHGARGPRRRVVLVLAVAAGALMAPSCGARQDGAPDTSARRTTTSAPRRTTTTTEPTTTTTTAAAAGPDPQVLRVLVTNDDGVKAPGLDALVTELRNLPGTQVSVVAPAVDRSGAGDQVSDDGVSTSEATTLSGYPATAVDGFPADAVAVALGEDGPQPDVVVSGVNDGANLGPAAELSGTVGAARAAAESGIPAVAVSQGSGRPPDLARGARLAVLWVAQQRESLLARDIDVVSVVNINVPTCTSGSVHGIKEVPAAPTANGADGTPNCSAATLFSNPTDDVQAYLNGWASQSELPLDVQPELAPEN